MFCRYCGTELPDEAIFCAECGKRLAGEDAPPAPARPKAAAAAAAAEHIKASSARAGTRGKAIFAAVKARPKNKTPETPGKRAFGKAEDVKAVLRLHKKAVLAACCAAVLLAAAVLGGATRSRPTPVGYQSHSGSGGAASSGSSSSRSGQETAPVSSGSQEPSSKGDAPAADSSAGSPKAEALAADGAVLPDPGIFLGELSRGEDMSSSGGHLVSYSFDIDGEDAVQEYLKLLKSGSYHLEQQPLDPTWNFSYEGTDYTQYVFDYTGSEDVGSVTELDATGAVILLINYHHGQGRIALSLIYGSGFALVDPGERASDPPKDLNGSGGGSSGGSSGSSSSNGSVKDCAICKGTGDCTVCGGDGYLYSSASGKEDRNCWKCHNHDGRCTTCNGTGKQLI